MLYERRILSYFLIVFIRYKWFYFVMCIFRKPLYYKIGLNAEKVLCLPVHVGLKDDEINQIGMVLAEYRRK